MRKESTSVNTTMDEMLKLSDNFKAAVMKMLQQAIMNSFKTNKK